MTGEQGVFYEAQLLWASSLWHLEEESLSVDAECRCSSSKHWLLGWGTVSNPSSRSNRHAVLLDSAHTYHTHSESGWLFPQILFLQLIFTSSAGSTPRVTIVSRLDSSNCFPAGLSAFTWLPSSSPLQFIALFTSSTPVSSAFLLSSQSKF